MADIVQPCEICGRIYNHTKLKMCPGCAGAVESEKLAELKSTQGKNSENSLAGLASSESIERLLKANIAAADRTTSAVRSIVSLFAILTVTAVVGYAIFLFGFWISSMTRNIFFMEAATVVAGIVGLGGVVLAYWQFFSEWVQSRIPTRY